MKKHVLMMLAVSAAVVLLATAQAGAQDTLTAQPAPKVSLSDIDAKLDGITVWVRYAAVLAGLALLSSLWNAHHLYTVAKNQVVAAKALAEKP